MMSENKLQSLSEIFNEKFFRIPDFQRGYAWEEAQLKDFWEDLELLNENNTHYTGVLSVKPVDKSQVVAYDTWQDDIWLLDGGFKAYYLIDGQQRLTTSIILINEILKKVKSDEFLMKSKNDWVTKFLYRTYKDTNKSYIFGYEKDNPSYECFKTKILNQSSLGAKNEAEKTLYTKNLERARDFFKAKIADMDEPTLEKYFKKLVHSFKFNFYEMENELDVCVAFETMNNRGKSLSNLELLKNRLIYLSTLIEDQKESSALRKDINSVWKTIYECMGRNENNKFDEDSFLRDHWIVYFVFNKSKSDAVNNSLLKETFTSRNFLDGKITISDIKEYIESLQLAVDKWVAIKNPHTALKDYNPETIEWLKKIYRLDVAFFTPLIMAMMLRYDEDEFLPVLKKIERFSFLLFKLSLRRADACNSIFYNAAHVLFIGDGDLAYVEKTLKENEYLFNLKAFQDFIDDKFRKSNGQGFYDWKMLRYFLYEYELHLQQLVNGESKVTWEELEKRKDELSKTVEHIYPQTPTDGSWKKAVDQRLNNNKKKINRVLHSIGNLVLLRSDKNISISNEPFEYKKKYANAKGVLNGYFNGSYSELEVAEYENWTIDEIHDRGVKMLKFIKDRWNINLEEEGFDIERILGINVAVNDKKRVSSLPDFSEELDDCEEEE
jgi:hypothetical protein